MPEQMDLPWEYVERFAPTGVTVPTEKHERVAQHRGESREKNETLVTASPDSEAVS